MFGSKDCILALLFTALALLMSTVLAVQVNTDIDVDTVWTKAQSPYDIVKDISVSKKLTIEAGALVRFDCGTKLTINGSIVVNGTVETNVIFTNLKEECAWEGIHVLETAEKRDWNDATGSGGSSIVGAFLNGGTQAISTKVDLLIQNVNIVTAVNSVCAVQIELPAGSQALIDTVYAVANTSKVAIIRGQGTIIFSKVIFYSGKIAVAVTDSADVHFSESTISGTIDFYLIVLAKFTGGLRVKQSKFYYGKFAYGFLSDADSATLEDEGSEFVGTGILHSKNRELKGSVTGSNVIDCQVAFNIEASALHFNIDKVTVSQADVAFSLGGEANADISGVSVTNSHTGIVTAPALPTALVAPSLNVVHSVFSNISGTVVKSQQDGTYFNQVVFSENTGAVLLEKARVVNCEFKQNSFQEFTATSSEITGSTFKLNSFKRYLIVVDRSTVNNNIFALNEPIVISYDNAVVQIASKDSVVSENRFNNPRSAYDLGIAPEIVYNVAPGNHWQVGSSLASRSHDYRVDVDLGIITESVVEVTGTISPSKAWSRGSVISVKGSVNIPKGVTLNIESGAYIVFESCSADITVDGELVILGTEGTVQFTSSTYCTRNRVVFRGAKTVFNKDGLYESGTIIRFTRFKSVSSVELEQGSDILIENSAFIHTAPEGGEPTIVYVVNSRLALKDSVLLSTSKSVENAITLGPNSQAIVTGSQFTNVNVAVETTKDTLDSISITFERNTVRNSTVVLGVEGLKECRIAHNKVIGSRQAIEIQRETQLFVTQNTFEQCESVVRGVGRLVFLENVVKAFQGSAFTWSSSNFNSVVESNEFSSFTGSLGQISAFGLIFSDNKISNATFTQPIVLSVANALISGNSIASANVQASTVIEVIAYKLTTDGIQILGNTFIEVDLGKNHGASVLTLRSYARVFKGNVFKNKVSQKYSQYELIYSPVSSKQTLVIESCFIGGSSASDIRKNVGGSGSISVAGEKRKQKSNKAAKIAIPLILIPVFIIGIVLAAVAAAHWYVKKKRENSQFVQGLLKDQH